MAEKKKPRKVGKMGPKKPISEMQIEQYDRLLATHPEIERKGKNLLYTSVNGHMFTMFSTNAKLGIRLSPADREEFLDRFGSELMQSYGVVMKDYAQVPDDLLADTATLAPYLVKSYDYVRSLKPKATTRKK